METLLIILKWISSIPATYSLYLAIGTVWFGMQSKERIPNAAKKHRSFRNKFVLVATTTLFFIECLVHIPYFHGHHHPTLFRIHMYGFVGPTAFLLLLLWGRFLLRKFVPGLPRYQQLHYVYGYLFGFFYTGAFITGGIQLYLF